MPNWLLVALGGALGATARYGASSWAARHALGAWPLGTFLVNVVGCLVAGAAFAWLERGSSPAGVRFFVLVGVLGGFTTFSALGLDTLGLFREGRAAAALLNAALQLALGLLATYAGWRVAGGAA